MGDVDPFDEATEQEQQFQLFQDGLLFAFLATCLAIDGLPANLAVLDQFDRGHTIVQHPMKEFHGDDS